MSYSFSVKAATKAEAIAAVIIEMDKVVASQPPHEHDREPAIEVSKAFINLLPEDESSDVAVSMNGWLTWNGGAVIGASVTASASLVTRSA